MRRSSISSPSRRRFTGLFAVMDGTIAGDGPGPPAMMPYVKNVILVSADQVAIDAIERS